MAKFAWNSGLACVVCLLVLGVTTTEALADSVVLPPDPHLVNNSIPFGLDSGDGRYQQVFDASLFTGPVSISSLAFSPNASGDYAADVEIRLGVTSVAVGALSTTLNDNVTHGLTTVLDDSTFTLALTAGQDLFSLLFDFSATPFVYDPTQGNLLLDVVISNKSGPEFYSRADSVLSGRAYNNTGYGSNANDGAALRARITFDDVAVPEPATLALMGLGLCCFGAACRRRRARR